MNRARSQILRSSNISWTTLKAGSSCCLFVCSAIVLRCSRLDQAHPAGERGTLFGDVDAYVDDGGRLRSGLVIRSIAAGEIGFANSPAVTLY